MNRSIRLWLAGGVVAFAMLLGWYRPLPPPSDATGDREGEWQLPEFSTLERSNSELFAATQGVVWVGGTAAGAPGAEWTLRGISDRDGRGIALVQAGSDPVIKRFQAGDTLPDGSILIEVGDSGIVVERDGCRGKRSLYPAGGAAGSGDADDCAQPGTTQGNSTQ